MLPSVSVRPPNGGAPGVVCATTNRVTVVTFVQAPQRQYPRDSRFPVRNALARSGTGVACCVRMIVSFLGTKGGTGTTTLAVNCAADIRRITNKSTVIVDLKSGTGDVALFLGLRPRHSLLTALDNLAWIDPLKLSRYVVEHECGLHVLAAGDDFARPGAREIDALEQTLRALNSIYDFVVVDAGTSLMTASVALQLSDTILLVANPDVPCLRNLQRLIDGVKA